MNNCSQICVNTDGSYECDCQRGYGLSGDGQTCEGVSVGVGVGVGWGGGGAKTENKTTTLNVYRD